MLIKRAFISVYDKNGLVEFGQFLADSHIQIIASGGTGAMLQGADIKVTTTEKLTGLPSILDGRVKTLHPAIHAGILMKNTTSDRAILHQYNWQPIDMVVVNLYPFSETIAKPDVTEEEAIEQIDIGGPTLIRAAAKNFKRVTVVTNPTDYAIVQQLIKEHGEVPLETRRMFAHKAFEMTNAYDNAIQRYFAGNVDVTPTSLALNLPQAMTLRYGENPHQNAAFYALPEIGPLGGKLLQGKPLSYNNFLDVDAAYAAATDFEAPTMVIVKHLSPTGLASNDDLAVAFKDALASDPISAFGGVVACNRPFDEAVANALGDLFVEAIAAPSFTEEALSILAKRSKCRLLAMDDIPPQRMNIRSVRGGVLVQTPDDAEPAEWKVVTEREPTAEEMESLKFAWKSVKHVKSNAIALAKGTKTVGTGGGLPSRVDAARLAVQKAGDEAQGAVMASDAFFPFADGLEVGAEAGVTAVVQPGGSIRDQEVIDAANKHNIAMIFTGMRHFKH